MNFYSLEFYNRFIALANFLFRFFVKNRRIAPLAIFFYLEFLALLFLVDCRGVVAAFALGASESDNICHVKFFLSCFVNAGVYFSTCRNFFRV